MKSKLLSMIKRKIKEFALYSEHDHYYKGLNYKDPKNWNKIEQLIKNEM